MESTNEYMARVYGDPCVVGVVDECVRRYPQVPRAEFEDAAREYGVAVTRPHEHWCAVCGIGLGGDA